MSVLSSDPDCTYERPFVLRMGAACSKSFPCVHLHASLDPSTLDSPAPPVFPGFFPQEPFTRVGGVFTEDAFIGEADSVPVSVGASAGVPAANTSRVVTATSRGRLPHRRHKMHRAQTSQYNVSTLTRQRFLAFDDDGDAPICGEIIDSFAEPLLILAGNTTGSLDATLLIEPPHRLSSMLPAEPVSATFPDCASTGVFILEGVVGGVGVGDNFELPACFGKSVNSMPTCPCGALTRMLVDEAENGLVPEVA